MHDMIPLLQARKTAIVQRQQELAGALQEFHALQEELRSLEALLRLYGSRTAVVAEDAAPSPALPLATPQPLTTRYGGVAHQMRALFADQNAPQRAATIQQELTARGIHASRAAVMNALRRNPRDFERVKRGLWRLRQRQKEERR